MGDRTRHVHLHRDLVLLSLKPQQLILEGSHRFCYHRQCLRHTNFALQFHAQMQGLYKVTPPNKRVCQCSLVAEASIVKLNRVLCLRGEHERTPMGLYSGVVADQLQSFIIGASGATAGVLAHC